MGFMGLNHLIGLSTFIYIYAIYTYVYIYISYQLKPSIIICIIYHIHTKWD